MHTRFYARDAIHELLHRHPLGLVCKLTFERALPKRDQATLTSTIGGHATDHSFAHKKKGTYLRLSGSLIVFDCRVPLSFFIAPWGYFRPVVLMCGRACFVFRARPIGLCRFNPWTLPDRGRSAWIHTAVVDTNWFQRSGQCRLEDILKSQRGSETYMCANSCPR